MPPAHNDSAAIAAQVAAHDAQIDALISGQKATIANVDKLAAAMQAGFDGIHNRINATTGMIESKVDDIAKTRANDRAWDWQKVSAAFGIIAALIGAAMYTMKREIDAAAGTAESRRQLDKAVFETHLSYYQRDFSKANALLDSVANTVTMQTQQIAGLSKESAWRSDVNAERFDRINSLLAEHHLRITGQDLPFISTQPRGPKSQSDSRTTGTP